MIRENEALLDRLNIVTDLVVLFSFYCIKLYGSVSYL